MMGAGQVWMGLLPGVHVKVTVTFVLFQPAALGDGAAAATIVGGTAGG